MFGNEGGSGGEGKGAANGVSVRDRAGYVIGVIVDVRDLLVTAGYTSGFAGDDVA